jgi:tripartite-type tricarboxylate transporter receptor subunit TctC
MHRRFIIRTSLLGSALMSMAWALPHAAAQTSGEWPDKPVRFILSQPAGSGPDNVARMLGERLQRSLGQPIVIDNKPGGQNVIGAQAAASAAPDGYSFYFATTAALVSNQYLFKTLPYDAQKDFAPVTFIAKSPFAVLVKGDSDIQTMPELIARAKATPGMLTLANEGPRTFGGIIARLINARSQMQANLVSYASVGMGVQDVMGGHAVAVVADLASTAQLVRQGRLRLLAVTSAKRVAGWDQVPALAELLPGFEMVGWFAVVAPSSTPAAAIQRLNRAIDTALAEPEIAQRMASLGPLAEPMGAPDQLRRFLGAEHLRWAGVAKEIGLLPE